MSRKNIILIVIAGITIGCVLFGTYYHVGKFTKRFIHNFPFIWDLSIFDDDKIDEIFDEDFEDDWIEEVNDKKDKERGRKGRNPYSFSKTEKKSLCLPYIKGVEKRPHKLRPLRSC